MSVTKDAWKKLQAQYERTAGRAQNIDYNSVIHRRKRELYEMASSRIRPSAVLEKYDTETRKRILKIQATSPEQFRHDKRKTWKKYDMFRYAGRMILLIVRACLQRKRYVSEETVKGTVSDRNRSKPIASSRSSLGRGLVVALTTPPDRRSSKQLRKVCWIVRTTKAFRQLFPPDRELECARNLGYAKYDDGRMIVQQDHRTDWFHYVIAGRIIMLRQYELTSGVVNKPIGVLTKGMTTDPEEIENPETAHDFSLVAKGHVEVLLLHKTIYHKLQSLGEGPPISYLRSLDLFEEFPVDMFVEHPECVEMKYYGDGKIIVKDTNKTPWIHIVKSGLVKVVRRQMVIDTMEDIFNQQNDDQLGCVKPSSHAYAMLGVSYKQRQNKLRSGEVALLPQLDEKICLINGAAIESTEHITAEPDPVSRTMDVNGGVHRDSCSDGGAAEHSAMLAHEEHNDEEGNAHVRVRSQPTRPKQTLSLPPLTRREKTQLVGARRHFVPHSFHLRREQTDVSGLTGKRAITDERRAYLELGTLGPGDVFGLEHLQRPERSEPAGLTLLSDGVEVVKVNKRFFLQYAQNNTMLKLETLNQQYMSDEKAKETLHDLQLWNRYKTCLMDRITEQILSKNSPKHKHLTDPFLDTHRSTKQLNSFTNKPRHETI